jgi:uncharacterized membrane protein
MLVKSVIVLGLLGVLVALGFAFYYLMTDVGPKKRTVNALAIRVSLSVAIIVFLALGYWLGWIEPHGITP